MQITFGSVPCCVDLVQSWSRRASEFALGFFDFFDGLVWT